MANTYLSRTTVTPTDATKFTFSAWCKIANVSGRKCVLGYNGGNHWYVIQFDNSSDKCRFEWVEFNSGGTKVVEKYTSASLRDINGYYHIVCKYNSQLSTVADRTKLYINGEVASLVTNNNPTNLVEAPSALGGHTQLFGAYESSSNNFDGIISHAHYCDGYAYDASSFGQTDSTTGEWKITTTPSVNYGNNGFFILKDTNSGTDQSGNNNHFTVSGGTLTKSEDCPSNLFPIWNSFHKPWAGSTTYTYGNTRLYNSDSSQGSSVTTLGANSGKYYMEMRQENANDIFVGVCGDGFVSDDVYSKYSGAAANADTGLFIYKSNGLKKVNGSATSSYFTTYGSGDIIGIALDLDASTRTVTFYKNGVADSAGTQDLPTNMQTGNVFGAGIVMDGGAIQLNAGNGYFANNAVSSAGTNASGNGIFEYDIPTGHTALTTKGLNL